MPLQDGLETWSGGSRLQVRCRPAVPRRGIVHHVLRLSCIMRLRQHMLVGLTLCDGQIGRNVTALRPDQAILEQVADKGERRIEAALVERALMRDYEGMRVGLGL